jgi:hypothetical protein
VLANRESPYSNGGVGPPSIISYGYLTSLANVATVYLVINLVYTISMTKGAIEKRIIEALAQNDFVLTSHVLERMGQRKVRRADIVECGRTAKKCTHDPARDTYKVAGFDLDGDDLTVVVGIDNGVVIVTVF